MADTAGGRKIDGGWIKREIERGRYRKKEDQVELDDDCYCTPRPRVLNKSAKGNEIDQGDGNTKQRSNEESNFMTKSESGSNTTTLYSCSFSNTLKEILNNLG